MGRGVHRTRRERPAPYLVESEGKTVLLSNGKRYLVNPNDRAVVRTWSMMTPLKLSTNQNLFFAVRMNNPESGETVAAKRLLWTITAPPAKQLGQPHEKIVPRNRSLEHLDQVAGP
jgi:hypothetical protein